MQGVPGLGQNAAGFELIAGDGFVISADSVHAGSDAI